MSSSDSWSQRRSDGFALAATAQSDRAGTAAVPGLAPDVVAQVTSSALALAGMEREPRRRWLQAVLLAAPAQLRATAALEGAPSRMLGLLATSVDRELGRTWLARAPRPRAGWTADPALIAHLRALAIRACMPVERGP